jgi:hypothetical protein
MESTIIMLAQEITRLRIIEQKYLELISNAPEKPKVIEIKEVKVKNPKRVAAGKRSAEIRAQKKLASKELYDELLANMAMADEELLENMEAIVGETTDLNLD